ncbi:MAG: BACON domain-containing protein [Bacteroidales bacterium]
MKHINFILSAVFCTLFFSIHAQNIPVHPTEVRTGTYLGLSKPLRDIPAMSAEEFHQLELRGLKRTLNKSLKNRIFPYAGSALPKGADQVYQNFMGKTIGNKSPVANFDGQTSPYYPPDCNGTAGPNHFMQTINCVYAIYDKTGVKLAGPTNLNQLFSGVPGANYNDGDPIILYDEQADRWLVTEFSFSGSTDYMLMAVSTTNDPTGTWHKYSFPVATMPDYPKFSVWQDGYYMGDNNTSGNDIYVFQREKMLLGETAQMVGFNNAWRPTSIDGFMCVPPIDNDGQFAPAGSPGMFIAFNDDALGGGQDQLWLYNLTVDWTTPSNSSFVRTQQVNVQPFNSSFGNNWNNIEQKGTSQRVDGIPQVIMNVPQYRNFGSYQTIVCCHTINIDGVHHAGIRWYELRKTTGDWGVRQWGTYAPDIHSRWMGSIMLNGNNEIGLGYSVSSLTMYPSIFYCGQSSEAYDAASGILDIAEDTIHLGANSQSGVNRWGDYSQLSVDPTDDKTFWYTTQYIGSGGARKTKIASFKFNMGPMVATLQPSAVSHSSATLNGTVNPNGLATEYHFIYGHSPMTMINSTPVVAVDPDTTTHQVSADLADLLPDTTYCYKIIGVNVGGTASGMTVSFNTAVAPFLNVSPPEQIVGTMAGDTSFLVFSNTDWTVQSDAEWCTVTSSGTGSDTIWAVYAENTTVTTRVAQITVSGTGVPSQIVTVTQAAAPPMLSVTPLNQNVTPPVGATQFTVTSNTLWTVVSDASWCTVTPAGSGIGVIDASYEVNTSVNPRTCNVTVSALGVVPQIVTVTQAGELPSLAVTPLTQNVPSQAGSTAFEVTSNTSWTIVSDASWCTVPASGSGNGTIVADYSVNTSYQVRTANIQVTVASLPVQKVTVIQAKSTIGVEEVASKELVIYPNPTKGIFMIQPGVLGTGTLDVSVQDLTGKVIMKKQFKGEKEYQIDLSGAPRGGYHIIIKTDRELMVRKLVVIK